VSGTVASLGTGSFTLTEAGGTSVTVDVTSSTTYSETGTSTAPGGVVAGERVLVTPTSGTQSTATTVTAAHVLVELAQIGGTVETVGTGSFTVPTLGGLTLTVDTTGSTTYTENGTTETGVTAGEQVTAFGTPDTTDPSQLDAQFVDIRPAPPASGGHPWSPGPGATWPAPTTPPTGPTAPGSAVTGKVQSVTGDDIVVVGSSGSTTTVVVSSSTKYVGTSGADSLAAVTDGVTITAFGASGGAGVVDAAAVLIGTPSTFPRPGAPGRGSSGPGGTWPGGGSTGGSTSGSTPPPTTPWTPPSGHPAYPGWSGSTTTTTTTAPTGSTSTSGSGPTSGSGSAGGHRGPGGWGPGGSPSGTPSGGPGSPRGPGSWG
jgi:hypothetical protein